MRYWLWIVSHLVELGIFAVLGFVVLFGVRSCRDKDQGIEAAVMKERLHSDSIQHIVDTLATRRAQVQLDSALAHGTQVIHDFQTIKVPVYIPSNATAHDTITSVSKRLSACYVAGDSLVQSIVKIQTACGAFRDTATKRFKDDDTRYARLDSLYKIGKPPKRWGIGPYIGYGFRQDSTWSYRRGFSAGIGIHYNIISF